MYNSPSQTRALNNILNKSKKKPKKKTEEQIFQKKKKATKKTTHRMPDGTIMTGAKHSASSKPIGKKRKNKKSSY